MDISEFDYFLPPELIAQEPAVPRESANLMVVHKKNGTHENKKVADLPSYIVPTDVVVINNTKVFKARLAVTVQRKGLPDRKAELFLIRPLPQIHPKSVKAFTPLGCSRWQAIGKPGKVFSEGANIVVAEDFLGEVVDSVDGRSQGAFEVLFPYSVDALIGLANRYGSVPVPPYIKSIPKERDYQTVYAKTTGSVAAPTAGFHLTNNIITQMKVKGVTFVEITLHVGLGTFLPVKTERLEDHIMHSEWVEITQQAADMINRAKVEGRRIVAIGTTTVRALEGVAMSIHDSRLTIQDNESPELTQNNKYLQAYSGDVNIFITPGFEFRIVDALLTNFHLPKSTLLVLVSTFAGKEAILSAYQEAVAKHYRFFSFGDAMFIE